MFERAANRHAQNKIKLFDGSTAIGANSINLGIKGPPPAIVEGIGSDVMTQRVTAHLNAGSHTHQLIDSLKSSK